MKQKGITSIYWGITAFLLIAVGFYVFINSDGTKPVSYETFENEMLLNGDVQKIIAYEYRGTIRADVYIRPIRLLQKKYDAYENKYHGSKGDPMAYITFNSFEELNKQLAASQKYLPKNERVRVEIKKK